MTKDINIGVYFVGSWLFSLFLCTHFLQSVPFNGFRDQIHSLLILGTYALMYLTPAMITYWLLKYWRTAAVILAVLLSVLSHVLIFTDSHLYDLYGFHINGFVWNLLTTPGGIESLGADQTNPEVILSYLSVLLSVHLIALFFAFKFRTVVIPVKQVIFIFFIATLSERLIYGFSRAQLYAPVLQRADAIPLYQPMKMSTFLNWLGIDVKKAKKIKMSQAKGEIQYPKHPLKLKKIEHPFNIIMLVSESMRWDLLTAEIMPNLFSFSQEAWNFKHHYSGGNGTRQGLFSLFYGIQGNYWDMFLRNKRGPVLFDVLNDYHYDYFIYTSASFHYPELDQTIFSQIPAEKLIEYNQGEPWKRDQVNTTALLNKISQRSKDRPYFGFIFYESTHARYSFPKEAILRQDYLQSLDYAGLSRKELAPQISGMKARYDNAAHGIDKQLKRVIDYLKQSGELNNTVLIITGDHGEEFMERNRWGHNSAYTEWQLVVPMVVWIPGNTPLSITQRTSHMDVGPTLLSRLGVQNQVKDYSLGFDLSTPKKNRSVIVASWSDIGLINNDGKLVIPFKSTTQHKNLATTLNDEPVDSAELTKKMKKQVMEAVINARYYTK